MKALHDLKILLVYANCMLDNLIPVGVSSLVASMRSLGARIELFDTTFYRTEERPADIDRIENLQVPSFNFDEIAFRLSGNDVHDDFRKQVTNFKPDMVMLSVVESTWDQGVGLLNAISDIRPYVVVGGVFAVMAPDVVITNDQIDAICIGEGEYAVVELLIKFAAGDDVTDTKGMWFKKEGKVIRNHLGSLVDLNTTPHLDFSLFPGERFFKPMQGRVFRMAPIEFSRGCPYHCTYCVNHAWEKLHRPIGKWFRWKTMDRIFEEIEHYVSTYQVEFFYFISESFLSMSKPLFKEFCDRYQSYSIPFWFNTRPETLTRDIVRNLKKIGCFRIGVGLEHGSPEFRESMLKRKVSNERIVAGCRLLEEEGVPYSVNNIIGFPGETREQIFETIMLNREIHPSSVGTFVFTPFRGTELYDYCVLHGYIDPSDKVGDLNRGTVLHNNTLSSEQIKGLLRTFPLYVHFSEEKFSLISQAERLDDEGNRVFKELAEIYTKEHFNRT